VTPVNDAPTISDIADQTTAEDTATGAIAFTIGDVETLAADLTVTGTSSNPTLVPSANIVFGGSGASRTVTVTPALNQFGSATITATVSDGSLTVGTSFVVTVNPTGSFAPVYLAIEAESGTLVSPMNIYADPSASGGNVINADAANSGSATYAVNIPVAGDYVVWCRVIAPSDSSDSFY